MALFGRQQKASPNGHDLLAGLNQTLESYKESALARAEEVAQERQRLEEQIAKTHAENDALDKVVNRVSILKQ